MLQNDGNIVIYDGHSTKLSSPEDNQYVVHSEFVDILWQCMYTFDLDKVLYDINDEMQRI